MARVKKNLLTHGLSGKIGDLVFRQRGDKTSVYFLSKEKRPESEKQKAARDRFSKAIKQASSALRNKEEYERFKLMAIENKMESAYSAAVAFFLKEQS